MKITARVFTILLTITCIPMLFIGMVVFNKARDTIVYNSLAHLESLAVKQKAALELVVAKNVSDANLLASRVQLRTYLAEYLQQKNKKSVKKINKILQEAKSSVNETQLIAITGPNEELITSIQADLNFAEIYEYAKKRLKSSSQPLTVISLAGLIGSDFLLTQRPLTLEGGELLGTIWIVETAEHISRIITDYTGLGETGETVLAERTADGHAKFIIKTRFSDLPQALAIVKKIENEIPITHAMSNKQSIFEYAVDYRGQVVLAATSYIENDVDWGIVIKQDRSEALESINELRFTTLIFAGLTILVTIITAIITSKGITSPLVNLADIIQKIRRGESSPDNIKLEALQAQDEIGELARSFRDLTTELVEANTTLEKRVEERTRELQRSNQDLEQFAYVASHDLQEPLRTVGTFAELLGKTYKGKFDEQGEKWLGFLIDGAIRMQTLVQDLLSFSRAGKHELQLEQVDIDQVVEHVIQDLTQYIDENNAQITKDSLPKTFADGKQIRLVFQNLLSNAIKFHNPDQSPKVHIGFKQNDAENVFFVKDHGIGIEDEYLERIFVIFQRLHGKNEFRGTGLGLAICKKIIERHESHIWVESRPGQGSTFYFTLPKTSSRT